MNSIKPIVIGIIPARYASQRLPAKPLIDLLGKPMIQRVYEQAKKSKLLDRVIVATDDIRIEKIVKQFGGEVVMTSTDIKSGSDRMAVVASQIAGDIYVNIQGDEPLLYPEMVDQAVRLLIDDESIQVSTLVKKIESNSELLNPNVVKVVLSSDNFGIYFSRAIIPFVRDEADTSKWIEHNTYYKHIGLYVFRREFLSRYTKLPISNLEKAEKLEQLRIIEAGYKIKVGITQFDSIPVDTSEDVARVIKILKQSSNN